MALQTDASKVNDLTEGSVNLPCRWRREIRKRKSGKTAGKLDIYFYSPGQKVFRSKKSLKLYLEQTHSVYKISDFDFCVQDVKKDPALSVNEETKSPEKLKETDGPYTDNVKDDPISGLKSFDNAKYESDTILNVKDEGKLQDLCQETVSSNYAGQTKNKSAFCKKSPYFSCKKGKSCEPVPKYFNNPLTKWNPPRSPYNLIQEDLYHDPWKMLVATICLQKTTGKAVKRVLSQFFEAFPSPQDLLKSQQSEVTALLQPLGLQEKKTKILKRFSEEFVNKQWRYPIELHGIGKYGNDSFRIFCVNEWKQVVPKDHMLEKYHQWLVNQHIESQS